MQPRTPISFNDMTPEQKQAIGQAAGAFCLRLCQIAPPLAQHFRSGGVLSIATMSGADLRIGFAPMEGGLILPGGIAPFKKG